jgi:hypothetical protein
MLISICMFIVMHFHEISMMLIITDFSQNLCKLESVNQNENSCHLNLVLIKKILGTKIMRLICTNLHMISLTGGFMPITCTFFFEWK